MRTSIYSLTIGAALLLAGCTSSSRMNNASSNNAGSGASEGWQSLFDGTSTKGWHTYGRSTAGSAWKAADGALYFDPSQRENGGTVGGGDLVTDEEYENFHLQLEWKV